HVTQTASLSFSLFKMKSLQKNLPPINTEYTEIRRKEFYSATLGDFGEVRRIIFSCLVTARPRWDNTNN
ncbi:MAG: hypothetical protein ACRENG_31400, partial [bacterium]